MLLTQPKLKIFSGSSPISADGNWNFNICFGGDNTYPPVEASLRTESALDGGEDPWRD